jgi:glucosamine-6-phosphate deaminase
MRVSTKGAAGSFVVGRARVQIFRTRKEAGIAAAEDAATLINEAIMQRGRSRIMIATGNSQLDMVEELTQLSHINWELVDVFHMDEYYGIDGNHPASFRRWIRERVEDRVHPASVNYIHGDADVDAELERYTKLLLAGPLDVAFVGFGENGHIAFNDPAVADFSDPQIMKRVALDTACRQQQLNEGHFETLADVPAEAITVSCSGLLRAEAWVSCVPEGRKANAVYRALTGPITTACPASIVRTHAHASVYLDEDSGVLFKRNSEKL